MREWIRGAGSASPVLPGRERERGVPVRLPETYILCLTDQGRLKKQSFSTDSGISAKS